MDEVNVGPAGIRLGQLLKLAGLVESGGSAKQILAEGTVIVNGRTETRRGAQLTPGDVIIVGDQKIRLT
jgi:ribosome-associated protein